MVRLRATEGLFHYFLRAAIWGIEKTKAPEGFPAGASVAVRPVYSWAAFESRTITIKELYLPLYAFFGNAISYKYNYISML